MANANALLGEVLVELGLVSPEQAEEALALFPLTGQHIGEALVAQGILTRSQMLDALLRALGLSDHQGRAAEPHPGPTRVVVVDDSPLACRMVEDGLTALGYEVISFLDPFEAVKEVHRLKPSIVISDLAMPGMDGNALCRRLKNGYAPGLPVILLTAFDTEAQKVSGLKAGADDYVNKSVSMAELAARIDSVIRRTSETTRLRTLFARYTSDAVVEEILKSQEVVLTGEKREVTVLFADLRNFTGLSERLPPEQVMATLNRVLGRLSDVVLAFGGTLDKYLGDGLMAVFGAPVARMDDGGRALQAARSMMEAVDALNEEAGRTGEPLVKLGIGINTGPVIAGNLGSEHRVEYTCIGDTVNVAARLCGLAGPMEILCGMRTRELTDDSTLELLPQMHIKGKAHPVSVFRVPWQEGFADQPRVVG